MLTCWLSFPELEFAAATEPIVLRCNLVDISIPGIYHATFANVMISLLELSNIQEWQQQKYELFGKSLREKHFLFDPQYHPLNHSSSSTFPECIRDHQHILQDVIESHPDIFLRYKYPELLAQSRSAIAPLLGVDITEVLIIPNATTGINDVLRNLGYGKYEVILYFRTVYGTCEKTLQSICDTSHVGLEIFRVEIHYPGGDEDIVSEFCDTVGRLVGDRDGRM
ncbi:hypothetical protein OCU04_007759 [Sclerotinia nivalis]|uniref:Uncharacterized protein n=1 Tax=Sclerotinia nivalis TaxID=352851 RepID=A0A9X0AKC5_9HELO|nr:hypothetical protein OCU04_007759 [Sclerotinia nivalis]